AGARAPGISRARSMVHTLPDDEIVAYLRALGGTPEELLANRELMDVALPAIRADFAAIETWQPRHDDAPLEIPIEALGGRDDASVSPDSLAAWRARTQGPFSVRWFSGGH